MDLITTHKSFSIDRSNRKIEGHLNAHGGQIARRIVLFLFDFARIHHIHNIVNGNTCLCYIGGKNNLQKFNLAVSKYPHVE